MKTKRRKKYNKKILRKKSYRKNFRKTFNKKKFRNLKCRGRLSKKFPSFFPKNVSDPGVSGHGVKLIVHNKEYKDRGKIDNSRHNRMYTPIPLPTREPPPGYLQSTKSIKYQTMIKLIDRLTELSNEKKKLDEQIITETSKKLNYEKIIGNINAYLVTLYSESEEAIKEHVNILEYNNLIGESIIKQNKIFLDIEKIDKEISTIRDKLKTDYNYMYQEFETVNNVHA